MIMSRSHRNALALVFEWCASMGSDVSHSLPHDWGFEEYRDALSVIVRPGERVNWSLLVRGRELVSYAPSVVRVEDAYRFLGVDAPAERPRSLVSWQSPTSTQIARPALPNLDTPADTALPSTRVHPTSSVLYQHEGRHGAAMKVVFAWFAEGGIDANDSAPEDWSISDYRDAVRIDSEPHVGINRSWLVRNNDLVSFAPAWVRLDDAYNAIGVTDPPASMPGALETWRAP